jgi:hypothetical protein
MPCRRSRWWNTGARSSRSRSSFIQPGRSTKKVIDVAAALASIDYAAFVLGWVIPRSDKLDLDRVAAPIGLT